MLHINVHALIDKYFYFFFYYNKLSITNILWYIYKYKNNILYKKKNTRRGKNHKSCININRTKENLCIKLVKICIYLSLNDVECYVNVHVIPWLTTNSLSHCPLV